MGILGSPSFLITYAVVQLVVLLLLIRFVDLYEHEPLSLVATMAAWGSIGATALSAIGNRYIHDALPDKVDLVFGSVISAPIVEELAKGIALLVAFTLAGMAHKRFGSNRLVGLTDGVVYGAAVGLGFAFTEDIHFLATSDTLQRGFAVFAERQGFLGTGMLRHAIFTAAFGAGLGVATWLRNRWARVGVATLGLFVAMLLHAINNGFVRFVVVMKYGLDPVAQSLQAGTFDAFDPGLRSTAVKVGHLIDYLVIIGFVGAIALWLTYQRRIIERELPAEVETGLIDYRDWELVPHYARRLRWYWELVRIGEIDRVRVIRRLHVELANLAFLRWRHGSSSIQDAEVAAARQRVANLKAAQAVDVYAPGGL